MPRKTTLGVTSETKDRVNTVKSGLDAASVDEAINELVDIAEREGYVDGEGEPTAVSREELERVKENQRDLADALADVRERVDAEA